MGDYDIRLSSYFGETLECAFSGNISFNGCAILSGKTKDDKTGIEGRINGILRLDDKQIMINFLKRDNENPVIEFQLYKKRDNLEYQGSYRGAWRCKQGIFRHEDNLWSRTDTSERFWTNEAIIRERLALIELLPSQEQPPICSIEISQEEFSDLGIEQDLKTEPAL